VNSKKKQTKLKIVSSYAHDYRDMAIDEMDLWDMLNEMLDELKVNLDDLPE